MEEAFQLKQPVRVLRAKNPKSRYAPKQGIRYDGMYEITDKEILNLETAFMRFSLKRLEGQDPIRWEEEGEAERPTAQEAGALMRIKDLLA